MSELVLCITENLIKNAVQNIEQTFSNDVIKDSAKWIQNLPWVIC